MLRLKNLSVIDIARQLVEQHHGIAINPEQLKPTDPKVFKTIQRGETDALFQIESSGMKDMFQKMHNVDMEALIAGVSLFRPGPMENIPSYIARANGEMDVTYLTPELEEILKPTYGIIVYQEQIMQIARKLGGYGQGESDSFRRAVGKFLAVS